MTGRADRGRRVAARLRRRLWTWGRAPFRLARFPGVLVAVFGASLVLSVAGASAPLFVSAGGAAALAQRIGVTSSQFAGLTLASNAPISPDRLAFRQKLAAEAARGLPFGLPVIAVMGSTATVVNPANGRRGAVQMVTREGFLPWIQKAEGEGTDGFWLARSVASALRVSPGDRLRVELGVSRAQVRVAGVYRDLLLGPLPSFWTPLSTLIYPPDPSQPPPSPFLLGDLGSFAELEGRLGDAGRYEFDLPLASSLTLSEARAAAAATERVEAANFDPTSPLNGAFDTVDSGLPALVGLAEQTVGATTQPVQAITLAGRLVALVLVAAAAIYGVRRRRVETDLLSARGLGPIRLGARTSLEAVLPAGLAAAAGWGIALVMVRALGPSATFDGAALRSSFEQGALGAAAGIVLFGLAGGAATRNEARERPGRLREAATRWPWEAAALALAGASAYEILTRGTGPTQAGQSPRFDLLILLFPFLFVAGTAGLLVRWLRGLLPTLKAASSRHATWLYLSASRLGSSPRLATTLVTASALAIGILTYAGVLSSSIEATATEKATLSIGSDVVVTVGAFPTVPGRPPFAWTPVQRFPDVSTAPGSAQADLLGVQPSTFAGAAYWNDRLGGSLSELMVPLEAPSTPLPVVVAGATPPAGLKLVIGGVDVPVRVVSRVREFPGAVRGKLTVVADRETVIHRVPGLEEVESHYELWAKGDPAKVLPVLRRHGFPLDLLTTAARVRATPAFLALSWTFGLLEAFGILAGLIAILGMVLYLQARQQAREVSYALARRMGLAPSAHRRSVLAELAAMLLSAFVLGSGFATVGAGVVHGRLDPIPNLSPGPFLRVPAGLFAVTAGGILLACAAGALLVQRRADGANVAEVMRVAG